MNEKYLYRFKTKKEFEKEYGENWMAKMNWNRDGYMDYLFGTIYSYNVKLPGRLPDLINKNINCGRRTWSIRWDMLTKNEPLKPNYKPKQKIERTL